MYSIIKNLSQMDHSISVFVYDQAMKNLSIAIRIYNYNMDIPFEKALTSNPNPESCLSALSYDNISIIIIVCSVLSLLWAVYNFLMVRRIDLEQEQQEGENDGEQPINDDLSPDQKKTLLQLSYKISDGSMQYIKQEYGFCLAILIIMFVIVWFATQKGLTTAISVLVGGLMNMMSSLLALIIATQSNFRIAYSAKYGTGEAFRTTYKACCAIGFGVSSFITLALIILIDIILSQQGLESYSGDSSYYRGLFESVAGFALGTSIVSIITRVSGGVFTTAAEVGAELVGKVEGGMPYQSPRNPATITQNVGQNIGELLGSVSEFSTSLTQSACVAFILSCTSLTGFHTDPVPCNFLISNFMYPLMAVALGQFFSMAVSTIATNFIWVDSVHQTQSIMRIQLFLIAFMMLGALYLASFTTFPSQFTLSNIYERYNDVQQIWIPYLCSAIGLVSIILLSLFNQFISSAAYFPVQSLVESSRSSSAANLANGLALGYISTIAPIILIASAAYFANMFLGFYGIALAAIGAICGFPLFLAHSVFAPLADNAYQMAKLSQLGGEPREKTQEMDQVGQSSAARSRAFAIHPAALTGMALFGGYIFNANLYKFISENSISITQPLIFTGVLLGAMIPFLFSGIILPAVQKTAAELLDNVRTQLRQDEGILQGNIQPDYADAAGAVAWSSLKSSIAPILIILLFPLAIGFGFGIRVVAGYLIGLMVSGIQFSLSGIASGQAWKGTKKMIESGSVSDEEGKVIGRGTQCHKSSLIGEEVGSSLQKTASLSLGAIIKLSGIVSVVFASQMLSVRN